MKPEIALITYSKEPNLADGDNLLIEPFQQKGYETVAVPWDIPLSDWKQYAAVVLRSCWNYHEHLPDFLHWLTQVEESGVKIFNNPNLIRWNTNKSSLLELQAKGAHIIPSVLVDQNTHESLKDIATKQGWTNIVMKPLVGASAYGIQKISYDKLSTFPSTYPFPALVQPFLQQINTEGEYSMIFFANTYSHAILKKPKDSDFRTQPRYGGVDLAISPAENLIQQAADILNMVGPTLYARVDGININGEFQLMELELAEPYLFFEFDKNSPERFVQALMEVL